MSGCATLDYAPLPPTSDVQICVPIDEGERCVWKDFVGKVDRVVGVHGQYKGWVFMNAKVKGHTFLFKVKVKDVKPKYDPNGKIII